MRFAFRPARLLIPAFAGTAAEMVLNSDQTLGRRRMMQLGALIPFGDIGGDPAVLREYAQTAESIGYHFIEAPDHVLGQNPAGHSAGERIADGLYHDPFVLFGYLAGICPKLGRSEEHTSELQSRFDLVCRLLLEKKNT